MGRSAFLRKAAQLCLGIAGLAQAAAADSESGGSVSSDHLIPPNQEIDATYESLLSQRLFVTPANYARVVVMPSSAAGEVAIAIYSSNQVTGEKEAQFTCTKADKNLWYSTSESNPNRGNEPPVKITRTDIVISQSAAVAVSEAINEMIRRTQPLEHEGRIILDGTAIEFSVEQHTKQPARGLLTPYAKGELSDTLHQLVKLLTDYCAASAPERRQIANDIQRTAVQLLEIARRKKHDVH